MNDEPLDLVAFRRKQAENALTKRIPPRFATATADHPAVAEWVRRYLADPAACPPLLLAGPVGSGKTHQCWGAVRAVVEGRAAAGHGTRWKATTHPDLNAEMRPKPDNAHAWALEPYLTAELLMFDDLGAGKQSEWTGDSLYRLVDYRWCHRLPTIWSTNLTLDQLVENLGDRVASRLADTVKVPLKGADRRWGQAA